MLHPSKSVRILPQAAVMPKSRKGEKMREPKPDVIKRSNSNTSTVTYLARIRIRRKDFEEILEMQSFTDVEEAKRWWRVRREQLLLIYKLTKEVKHQTIGDLIDLSLKELDLHPMGRSKFFSLRKMRSAPLSRIKVSELEPDHIVAYERGRSIEGAKPQTVAADISHVRSLFISAYGRWGMPIDDAIFHRSYPVLMQLKLVAPSNRRQRRPTQEEIDKLLAALEIKQNRPQTKHPYRDLMLFSILTCMRIGEVCRLRWEDINHDDRTILVRDRKDPRKKIGNYQYVPLLGDAWDIALSQPRTDDRIFPYNGKSIGYGFARTCKELDIPDLRYHDLRREGASRLMEMGFSLEEVSEVTGHKDLKVLKQVYTDLNSGRLHQKYRMDERFRK